MRVMSFLCLTLVLTAAWMQVYSSARQTFNGVGEYKMEIERLKHDQQNERQHIAIERDEFLEFRQNIAALMPEVVHEKGEGKDGYAYRSLASTISRTDSEKVRVTIAKTLFERGKEHFKKKEYAKAGKIFRQIIDRFGFTTYVPESYFLLAESHFQKNEFEECTSVIQQMIELFPHHELTGFAMVRLGRVYEVQNRNEEAVDIYKTVLRSFQQRDVTTQAKASLKGMDL